MTTTLKATLRRLESRTAHHLKNAWIDGEYELERATDFWTQRDDTDCLAGERQFMGSGLMCKPLRFTGKSLLVYLVDTKGTTWFAWIHS